MINGAADGNVHSSRYWPWKDCSLIAKACLSWSELKIRGPRKTFQWRMKEKTRIVPKAGSMMGTHIR